MMIDHEVSVKPETTSAKLGMAAFYLAAGALVYTLDVGLPTDLGDGWIYAYLIGWPVVVVLHLLKVVLFALLAVVCIVAFLSFEDRRARSRFVRGGRTHHPAR